MVVGLLTMIAMLGGTLLVVAYLDAKQSEAFVSKVVAEHLAGGVVAEVAAALNEDVDIKDNVDGP